LQQLQALGWTDGRNMQIDTRWAAGNDDWFRTYGDIPPDVVAESIREVLKRRMGR